MIWSNARNWRPFRPFKKCNEDYAAYLAKFYRCEHSTESSLFLMSNTSCCLWPIVLASSWVSWRPSIFGLSQANDYLTPTSLSCLLYHLGSFLRYLHLTGLHKEDLSRNLPHVRFIVCRIPRYGARKRLPPSGGRRPQLPQGKTDYAILILAARLDACLRPFVP